MIMLQTVFDKPRAAPSDWNGDRVVTLLHYAGIGAPVRALQVAVSQSPRWRP